MTTMNKINARMQQKKQQLEPGSPLLHPWGSGEPGYEGINAALKVIKRTELY